MTEAEILEIEEKVDSIKAISLNTEAWEGIEKYLKCDCAALSAQFYEGIQSLMDAMLKFKAPIAHI